MERLRPRMRKAVWPVIDKHPADRSCDQTEQRDRAELPDDHQDGGTFNAVEKATCDRTQSRHSSLYVHQRWVGAFKAATVSGRNITWPCTMDNVLAGTLTSRLPDSK